jgi:hypothetical protein
MKMLLMGALALGPNDISSNNARITHENRINFRAAFVQMIGSAAGMKTWLGMARAKT